MHILLITQEPPLRLDTIATGNAVRTTQLDGALCRAGHTTSQIWLDKENSAHPDTFQNRDELNAAIITQQADAILVSYWELLELLPFDLSQPVILDFVAPRPLEELFQRPDLVGMEIQRLQNNLTKCDLLLTGNQEQCDLLWFTLLQAGFDLRIFDPLLVVPLAADPVGSPASDPQTSAWTLVSGGVDWPWRKSEQFWQAIQSMKDDTGQGAPHLVMFGGEYRWGEVRAGNAREGDLGCEVRAGTGQSDSQESSNYQSKGLAPYSHFSRFLTDSAHIGLELADSNIERKHSQSFRSLEFLRHGLPLICNDYLPIAGLVKQYEAGWTVNQPNELPGLLQRIMNDPAEWKKRSANALRLVEEVLNPDKVVKPLLEFLENPSKAARLPVLHKKPAAVVLAKPPWPERLKRQARLLKQIGLRRLFRSRSEASNGEGILIVTRKDLFPADHGGAVKIVETARGLSQHGRKVGIVSDDRNHWWLFENGKEQRCRLPFWLRFLSMPRSLARLLHFSKNLPASNSFLYLPLTDNGFFWNTLYVGRRLNAGILQAEFPAYAKPCIEAREILNAAVVLVEHNVEYARLKAQVTELTDEQFSNLRAIEIYLCNHSDAVICVSDNDRQRLMDDGVKSTLLNTIPHGFNPEPYNLPAKTTLHEDFGIPGNAILIAFHGTFSYPPNRDALHVFEQILLPQLAGSSYNFHVIAIGRDPPAEKLHPNIHFTGSVDEVGPWLKACDLAVIPLREGGGTRMKIIDCFAAGLPVISTSKGIEGISVVNGREAIISDDWLSMTNEIISLAESKERRDNISSAASEFVSALDWKSICKRYLDIYSAILPAPK